MKYLKIKAIVNEALRLTKYRFVTGLSVGKIKKRSSQPRSPIPEFEFDTEELIKSKYSTGIECARATCDWQPQHINR